MAEVERKKQEAIRVKQELDKQNQQQKKAKKTSPSLQYADASSSSLDSEANDSLIKKSSNKLLKQKPLSLVDKSVNTDNYQVAKKSIAVNTVQQEATPRERLPSIVKPAVSSSTSVNFNKKFSLAENSRGDTNELILAQL